MITFQGPGPKLSGKKTMLEDRERLERMGVAVEPFLFDGGHEWSETFNQAVGAFLKRLARCLELPWRVGPE